MADNKGTNRKRGSLHPVFAVVAWILLFSCGGGSGAITRTDSESDREFLERAAAGSGGGGTVYAVRARLDAERELIAAVLLDENNTTHDVLLLTSVDGVKYAKTVIDTADLTGYGDYMSFPFFSVGELFFADLDRDSVNEVILCTYVSGRGGVSEDGTRHEYDDWIFHVIKKRDREFAVTAAYDDIFRNVPDPEALSRKLRGIDTGVTTGEPVEDGENDGVSPGEGLRTWSLTGKEEILGFLTGFMAGTEADEDEDSYDIYLSPDDRNAMNHPFEAPRYFPKVFKGNPYIDHEYYLIRLIDVREWGEAFTVHGALIEEVEMDNGGMETVVDSEKPICLSVSNADGVRILREIE